MTERNKLMTQIHDQAHDPDVPQKYRTLAHVLWSLFCELSDDGLIGDDGLPVKQESECPDDEQDWVFDEPTDTAVKAARADQTRVTMTINRGDTVTVSGPGGKSPPPSGLVTIRTRTQTLLIRPEAIDFVGRVDVNNGEPYTSLAIRERHAFVNLDISPDDFARQLAGGA